MENLTAIKKELVARKAAAVVLYNPEEDVLSNIFSYSRIVEKVFIIDNSEKRNQEVVDLLQDNEKLIYVFNGENIGVAGALNLAAKKAIEMGFGFLLTMDQDSRFLNSQMADCYGNVFGRLDNLNNIAVISLATRSENRINKELIKIAREKPFFYKNSLLAITSGSWINLNLYRKIGEFNEALFIDVVDYDYCLRARLLNFGVIHFVNLFILHKGGIPKIIFNRNIPLYSPLRMYYITRNHLYFWLRYFGKFPVLIIKNIYATLVFCLLFQIIFNRERFSVLIRVFRGFIDFVFNKYGRFKN